MELPLAKGGVWRMQVRRVHFQHPRRGHERTSAIICGWATDVGTVQRSGECLCTPRFMAPRHRISHAYCQALPLTKADASAMPATANVQYISCQRLSRHSELRWRAIWQPAASGLFSTPAFGLVLSERHDSAKTGVAGWILEEGLHHTSENTIALYNKNSPGNLHLPSNRWTRDTFCSQHAKKVENKSREAIFWKGRKSATAKISFIRHPGLKQSRQAERGYTRLINLDQQLRCFLYLPGGREIHGCAL
ncbi:hypothetical protein DL89DRAFT_267500 [Linderina pennispora]|uniref:Uncharacterized protein n=1 Tax=Linderina pennispora TaxID=61395 RepID=A0A1Y1WAU2_9FUNG|nr:uncharacterized protein DL89DRAFT_267500 [Linderina pennispora]ORX70284.1 hypothetical protein DL89DRAFT_267500 [Linderina pennispora]